MANFSAGATSGAALGCGHGDPKRKRLVIDLVGRPSRAQSEAVNRSDATGPGSEPYSWPLYDSWTWYMARAGRAGNKGHGAMGAGEWANEGPWQNPTAAMSSPGRGSCSLLPGRSPAHTADLTISPFILQVTPPPSPSSSVPKRSTTALPFPTDLLLPRGRRTLVPLGAPHLLPHRSTARAVAAAPPGPPCERVQTALN